MQPQRDIETNFQSLRSAAKDELVQSPEFKFQEGDDQSDKGGERFSAVINKVEVAAEQEADATLEQHVQEPTRDLREHLREQEMKEVDVQDKAIDRSEEEEQPVK